MTIYFCKKLTYILCITILTSIRNSLVGITIPSPTELRKESRNFGKEKSRIVFSVNLLRLPEQANVCPWIPASLSTLNGRSKERSAKAVTARSPPRKSLLDEASELPPSAVNSVLGSVRPRPHDLKPNNIAGVLKEQTAEVLRPKENPSGKQEGVFTDLLPHGKTALLATPKFKAALQNPKGKAHRISKSCRERASTKEN